MVNGDSPCTFYCLVQYRLKTGNPSIGDDLIRHQVIHGTHDGVALTLDTLLHTTADASSLKVLGFCTCYEAQWLVGFFVRVVSIVSIDQLQEVDLEKTIYIFLSEIVSRSKNW